MNRGGDATHIAKVEADNRRLRRLLEVSNAPEELRHRARNTLALLRTVIRRSARSGRSIESYVAHLEDRLDSLARAQAAVDTLGQLDLHTIVAEELFYYTISEGDRLTLDGPPVTLPARTGEILSLAIHELAVNAVEHGAFKGGDGRVDVLWSVVPDENGRTVTFTWKELGQSDVAPAADGGFGFEILTRTLPYSLEGKADLALEPDGLRYMVRFACADACGTERPD